MSRAGRLLSAMVLLVAGACGEQDRSSPSSPPPPVPMLAPGMAMVDGQVMGSDRQPIAGATVTVLDAAFGAQMAATTTGPDGRWQLAVPANTTITLRAEAMGYARSYANSFALEADRSSGGLELMLLPLARVEELNALAGPRTADYGVIALRVLSLGGGCDPAGGKVTFEPAPLGRVLYGKSGEGMPDVTLAAVQKDAQPAAWVLGVLPPGTYYRVAFEKAGCTQEAGPVTWSGRSYNGHLPIEAKALSQGLVFVE